MGAQWNHLTSLPQGKTRYPPSSKVDRNQGHPGWVQAIPPTDIQSQYHPAHTETHFYKYISLIRMFLPKKNLKESQYTSNDPWQWRSRANSYQQEIKQIWKNSFQLCFLRNNLLHVPRPSSLIL